MNPLLVCIFWRETCILTLLFIACLHPSAGDVHSHPFCPSFQVEGTALNPRGSSLGSSH
jgi:hypothetical protein